MNMPPDVQAASNPNDAPGLAATGNGFSAPSVTLPLPIPTQTQNAQGGDIDPEDEDGVRPLSGNKVQVLTTSAYKRIKESARAKGERLAQDKLEARAKSLGFVSADAMFANFERTNNAPQQNQQRAPQQAQPQVDADEHDKPEKGGGYREQRKYQLQIEKLKREQENERKLRIQAERRAKQAQMTADANAAEAELRQIAAMTGIADVDYGVALLQREISGKDARQLRDFDEKAFFDNLRASKPYLFGETRTQVNTGVPGGSGPVPSTTATTTQQANMGKVDARKMSPEEYRAYLQKKGMSSSGVG